MTFDRPASVCVIERGRNPSTDYYILPRLDRIGAPIQALPGAGGLVVIVRYLDSKWRDRIESMREQLAGIVYFMDDDLLDLAAIGHAPLPYSARMAWLAWRHRPWLRRVGARLWVSTPFLANKYRDWNPELVPPAPRPELLGRCAPPVQEDEHSPVRVFYHGTGLHRTEIRWLAPVVRAVQTRNARTNFEVFGRAWVERLYRDVPRTSVLRPLGWEDYRRYCAGHTFHVGLAPLLPHAFNAARSHTRFYDLVRCGAAGIFSNVEPYASFVRHETDGLLVDNDPNAWTDAILRLAEDSALRERIVTSARQRSTGGR